MDLQAAHDLARELLARHGPEGWSVAFDSAKRRAGVCRYADRVIGLSAPLTGLHGEAEVRDTILHEIAHALAGPRAGHGPRWVALARSIGCSALRCVPEDAPRVPGEWVGVCPAGHVVERHRRPERVTACGTCSPSFSADHLLEWAHRGRPAAMHPNYLAELDALRAGRRPVLLALGTRVRVTAPEELAGRVGVVVGRGRTRYQVRLPEGVVGVLFAAVAPVGRIDRTPPVPADGL